MRLNKLFLGIGFIFILNLFGCEKDNFAPPSGSGSIKRILLYFSTDSDTPAGIIKEYEYDENGRISRTSTPMYQDGIITGTISYDLYYYNDKDQLIKKEDFNANINSPTGFIKLINHYYSYSSAGKLTKEILEYPMAGYSESISYEYRNGLLYKTGYYDRKEHLETYIVNKYDKYNLLIQETRFFKDNKVLSVTKHSYKGSLLIKTDVYQGDTHMREILRSYDSNNNLIILESKELSMFSSAMSYVLKYEYFG